MPSCCCCRRRQQLLLLVCVCFCRLAAPQQQQNASWCVHTAHCTVCAPPHHIILHNIMWDWGSATAGWGRADERTVRREIQLPAPAAGHETILFWHDHIIPKWTDPIRSHSFHYHVPAWTSRVEQSEILLCGTRSSLALPRQCIASSWFQKIHQWRGDRIIFNLLPVSNFL